MSTLVFLVSVYFQSGLSIIKWAHKEKWRALMETPEMLGTAQSLNQCVAEVEYITYFIMTLFVFNFKEIANITSLVRKQHNEFPGTFHPDAALLPVPSQPAYIYRNILLLFNIFSPTTRDGRHILCLVFSHLLQHNQCRQRFPLLLLHTYAILTDHLAIYRSG